eukprot:748937-Hanusia_phi.AAC.1
MQGVATPHFRALNIQRTSCMLIIRLGKTWTDWTWLSLFFESDASRVGWRYLFLTRSFTT